MEFNVTTASKRAKFLEQAKPENNNPCNVFESASKFEWLHPSRIRDSKGRRPGDPFFDKTTLYIPPDTLKKMSASQKQYWSVKCLYMDVLLFFKVGKFYELYELDAEIGHKELDWKMTISGVGRCRQDHEAEESDAETLSILVELFVEKAIQWSQITFALNCIGELRSFAAIAIDSRGPMSRPSILPQSTSGNGYSNDKGPILKVKGLWHPFALGEHGIPVPNDLVLGEDVDEHHPCTLLLTGPNMEGKSTLLRAVCLAVVIEQLGCYVPSDMCTLSVADIIFTRLGASVQPIKS